MKEVKSISLGRTLNMWGVLHKNAWVCI